MYMHYIGTCIGAARGMRNFRLWPSETHIPRAPLVSPFSGVYKSVNDGTSLGAGRRMCSRRSPARVSLFAGGGLGIYIAPHAKDSHIVHVILLYNIRNRNNIVQDLRHYFPYTGRSSLDHRNRVFHPRFFFTFLTTILFDFIRFQFFLISKYI